jgi:hypothetical protein
MRPRTTTHETLAVARRTYVGGLVEARVVADEASRAHTTTHETLAAARRAHMEAIVNVDIATADKTLCVAKPHDRT